MGAVELARANRRLAGAESFTVAPSKYLGHYVAGHLASRHGIAVELQDSPAGGVVAKAVIPSRLFASDSPPADVEPDAGATPEPVLAGSEPRIGSEPSLAYEQLATTSTESRELEPTPGFGGLATVARAAPSADNPTDTPSTESTSATTPSGLARRIPGAQRPDASPLRARLAALEDEATPDASSSTPRHLGKAPGAQQGSTADAPNERPGERSTPDDVYAFLSSFVSGVERGRSDTEKGHEPTDGTEDER
jgi:hypothetical protein